MINFIITIFIFIVLSSNVCFSIGTVSAAEASEWDALVEETKKISNGFMIGSWTGWSGGGAPGTYSDFIKWGLDLKVAHPEYYALIDQNGDLKKPGYQDRMHKGEASIDFYGLIKVIREISNQDIFPVVGLFIHNFEAVTEDELISFFKKFSSKLKEDNISQVIFIPAWEIQGEWPAWPEGATRDCYIDPEIFNQQIKKFIEARNRVGAYNIKIAVAMAGGIDDSTFNRKKYTGYNYIEGLRSCDMIGADYYPTRAKGPEWVFKDAQKWRDEVGGDKPFGIFEYCIETKHWISKKDIIWSEAEKIRFIRETYQLLKQNPFITHLHWWFIGKGDYSRIKYLSK